MITLNKINKQNFEFFFFFLSPNFINRVSDSIIFGEINVIPTLPIEHLSKKIHIHPISSPGRNEKKIKTYKLKGQIEKKNIDTHLAKLFHEVFCMRVRQRCHQQHFHESLNAQHPDILNSSNSSLKWHGGRSNIMASSSNGN